MDIKESYQVLELDIGASRAAVDAAYFRLIERWHPDRAKDGGPEAIRKAEQMVQSINEAYQTLIKIVPDSAKTTPPMPMASGSTKARLAPLPPGPPASVRPPPGVTVAPFTSAASVPSPLNAPPTATAPISPAPAASPTLPAPTSNSMTPTPKPPAAPTKTPANSPGKAVAFYNVLFPPDSPRRRFGPFVIAGVILLLVLAVMRGCSKSPEEKHAAQMAVEAQITGRLVVKSNRPNTTLEATRLPAAGEAATPAITSPEEGAAEPSLSGMPPGRYTVIARSEGWPAISQEVNIIAGQATTLAVNFKSGSLRLDSDPSGASVRLGNTALGKTPLVIPQLPPGECPLTLEYQSWPASTFKATITENTEAAATVRLPHGKLIVESDPSGAIVLSRGRPIGQTPLTIEQVPIGVKKLTLQSKEFPEVEVTVTVHDQAEAKVKAVLATGLPELDPATLLQAVWVYTDGNTLAPQFDSTSNAYRPKNDIVKNLNRKRLALNWLNKRYRISGIIKSYDKTSGQIEFAEQKSDLSKYHVLATLSVEARSDKDMVAALVKDATFAVYGTLTAVEEPRWASKGITFELSATEVIH